MIFGTTADTPGLHALSIFLHVIAALALALTLADRSLARIGRDCGLMTSTPSA